MKFLIIAECDPNDVGTVIKEVEYDINKVTHEIDSMIKEYSSYGNIDFSVYLVQCEYKVLPKEIIKTVELQVKE